MGPVGLIAVVAVKAFGASNVIVTDLEENRLKAAKRLGATHTINIKKDNPAQKVKELTSGEGMDVAFETAGHPIALKSALSSLKRGGKLVIVGLSPEEETGVNTPMIADNEIDI
jgi:L-iditol 2-dehydrogenase